MVFAVACHTLPAAVAAGGLDACNSSRDSVHAWEGRHLSTTEPAELSSTQDSLFMHKQCNCCTIRSNEPAAHQLVQLFSNPRSQP